MPIPEIPPAPVLVLFLTGASAVVFHLIWGRASRQLISTWLLGLLGFALGHWLTTDTALPFPLVGTIRIVPAMLGCLFGMLVANALKL